MRKNRFRLFMFLCILGYFWGTCSLRTGAETPVDENVTNDTVLLSDTGELVQWLASHVDTPGSARMVNDIALPENFEYSYLGEGELVLQTGPFTLTANGAVALGGVTDYFTIRGEGVDGPVLSGNKLSLGSKLSVMAYGRDGLGGTAVESRDITAGEQSEFSAFGSSAAAVKCESIYALKTVLKAEGKDSVALQINAVGLPGPSNLFLCTITASGENAVPVIVGENIPKPLFSGCRFEPQTSESDCEKVLPAAGWNRKLIMASPAENYRLPDTITVNVSGEQSRINQTIEASLSWQEGTADFSRPGVYEVTGKVTDCFLTDLIGESVVLTVQIGNDLIPVLGSPEVFYDYDGSIYRLNFYMPESQPQLGMKTKLWYSGDNGLTWSLGDENCFIRAELSLDDFNMEQPYLLFLQSEQDGIMNGMSLVWKLILHSDTSFELTPENIMPPENPEIKEPSAGSWEELFTLLAYQQEEACQIKITQDLAVEDYINIGRETGNVYLDLGENSITVKEGGWLVLNSDELKGSGSSRALITVEKGGSLSIQNYGDAGGLQTMKITAEGNGIIGGTAIELQEGACFYAENNPVIAAYGYGATALRSLTVYPFYLPDGLSLYAKGENAVSLMTEGAADIFYSQIRAEGSGARAVRAGSGAAVTIDSAAVLPEPENAVHQASSFVDFNEDMSAPINLWKGPVRGLYLSDTPRLITVARGGDTNRTEAVWVDCRWDSSGVDFLTAGKYIATAKFSPFFGITLPGLPEYMEIEVGIRDAGGQPDISITHALTPVNNEAGDVIYGFYINGNAAFSVSNAKLWCSVDNGENWTDAGSILDVFMEPVSRNIYVTGLIPEKTYLFRLESFGQDSTFGEYVMAGSSEVRQIILHSGSRVTNIGWSGDRDGGDTDGNPPAEVWQPVPESPGTEGPGTGSTDPENGHESSGSEEETEIEDETGEEKTDSMEYGKKDAGDGNGRTENGSQNNSAGENIKGSVTDSKINMIMKDGQERTEGISEGAVSFSSDSQVHKPEMTQGTEGGDSSSESEDTGTESGDSSVGEKKDMEFFGRTKDEITGTRLLMMQDTAGKVRFSKQGVTVTLSAGALEKLHIEENDRFVILINLEEEDTFSFYMEQNGTQLTELVDTQVSLPYPAIENEPMLQLLDEQGMTVSQGSYQKELAVASFTFDHTGRFTIREEIEEKVYDERTAVAQKCKLTSGGLLAAGVALAVLGMSILLIRRRKRRE